MNKIRKIPTYIKKLILKGNLKEIIIIARHFKARRFLSALAARLDRREAHLELKGKRGYKDVNLLLDVLPFKSRHVEGDYFLWNYRGKIYFATQDQFEGLFSEYLKGQFDDHYGHDWAGKQVLDIGGYIGDSARYFLEKNAKHVVVYEPSEVNQKALQFNLQDYQDKIDVFKMAVTEKDGPFTLSSNVPEGVLGFGMENGSFEITCEGITFTRILKNSDFDVAKVDCEGGEAHLITTDKEYIQKIPYWIVETHSSELHKQIGKKFLDCGFKKVRDISLNESVSLLHFSSNI